tara:strand:+ start:5664 stop:5954 length:291 start_codon:yes stop_codon:yes gene_type:complete
MILENVAVLNVNAPTEVLVIKSPQSEVFQIAYASFKDRGFDLTGYDVILLETEQVWMVYYQPSDSPRGQRGSAGAKGFTVEVDKVTHSVIKSYFAR